MARDIRPSKGMSKAPSFLKKHPDRARRKAHSQSNVKTRAIDDVYEYIPSKVRRAKVALSLDRHEAESRRNDPDDEIDLGGLSPDAMERLRTRLMRDDEDEDEDGVGGMDSEDDEDIDSEDAFEESDREAFAGSAFVRRGTQRGTTRKNGASNGKRQVAKEVDLNEDFDAQLGDSHSVSENEDANEIERENADEFFDVLDVFDGRAHVENDEHPPLKTHNEQPDIPTKTTTADDEDEWGRAGEADVSMDDDEVGDEARDEEQDEREDEDDAVEEDDELGMSDSDVEDSPPEALADLETFLSNLDPAVPHKRKPDEIVEPSLKKRQRVTDRTEAGEESEFGVRGSSTLKLDDLLAPLASSSSFAALKRSTKPLTSSSLKTKTLSAPLPQRVQERLDREAAYEQTKEEVDKWSATMKRIKEAEHLSFPLQVEGSGRVSNLELAAKFMPSNELESAVDKLLKSAQLRDEDIPHTEALKMAHLTVEEVAARRAELRMMRELAFRADRKAKRIAKIKSKTYRRIRKKQRERLDDTGDGADGGEEDDEGRLKAEAQRARERATLRHKNTGKWAKAMKGREGLDQDQRQAIGEMLERGERLRRRIHGENSDEEGHEDTLSDEEEQNEEEIKRGAFEELAALQAEDDANLPELKSKSVFDMKFMRDAAARRSREADARAEELQRELGFVVEGQQEDDDDDDGTDSPTAAPAKDATMVQRTGGRLSFRPGTVPGTLKPLGSLASDTSSVTLQSSDLLQELPAPEPTPIPSVPTPTSTLTSRPNPWLVSTAPSGPSKKRNEVRVHKGADALTKSSNKLKKQTAKHADEKERAKDDATVEIDTNNVLTVPESPVPKSKSGEKVKGKARAGGGVARPSAGQTSTVTADDGSDVPSEVEEQERAAKGKSGNAGNGIKAFQQRDLVALAFAGDNVVQAFEVAKRQETEADGPHEVDTTLPGWGTWGGTGTKKPPPKPHLIKSVPGVAPTARTDHHKPHLIISEKRDKKAAKYLVRDLPYPYTSHAQFERRMEVPLGSEWNTRVGFQRATLPRVVKKMGVVIDPLEKLF